LLASVPAAADQTVGVEFTLVVEPLLTNQASHNYSFGRVSQSVGLGVVAGPREILTDEDLAALDALVVTDIRGELPLTGARWCLTFGVRGHSRLF